MIGMDTRISSKLYKVNVKNGKQLREKFTNVNVLRSILINRILMLLLRVMRSLFFVFLRL